MERVIKKFDLNRFNLEKIKFGSKPLSLIKDYYPEPNVINGFLVDNEGKSIGTKGDMYQKIIMDKILQDGCLDHSPRPHYEDFYKDATYDEANNVITTSDGKKIEVKDSEKAFVVDGGVILWVPAHTLSLNQGVECVYDLSKGESPMITLRPIAVKNSISEILWIYQKQSNDLVEFDELKGNATWDLDHKINNWWKDWAIRNADGSYDLNEKGHPHIGDCYGGTTGKRDMIYRELINPIKTNMDGRRNILCLWQIDDFNNPHGLKPCAFLSIWNVRHDWDGKNYLDMTLVQRSSDFATAGCINQVQYAALQIMIARELNLIPGIFTWKPVNIQLYDRHIEQAIEMLNREPIDCKLKLY